MMNTEPDYEELLSKVASYKLCLMTDEVKGLYLQVMMRRSLRGIPYDDLKEKYEVMTGDEWSTQNDTD